MSLSHPDFSPLKKLDLKEPAMGVRFDFFRPKDIEMLDKDIHMSICEIFRYAQKENKALYFSYENDETCVGKIILGMQPMNPMAASGQIGKPLGVFNETRANAHFYQHIRKLEQGTCNFVSIAPVDKMNFNPDLLILTVPPQVGEVVLRAASYSTGCLYESVCTPVMGCSWFLAYPFRTGKINYIIPRLVHGPHGRELYEDPSTMIISIPYHWIPTVLQSLEEIPVELSGHISKEAYYSEFNGILADLASRAKEEGLID